MPYTAERFNELKQLLLQSVEAERDLARDTWEDETHDEHTNPDDKCMSTLRIRLNQYNDEEDKDILADFENNIEGLDLSLRLESEGAQPTIHLRLNRDVDDFIDLFINQMNTLEPQISPRLG